jgi:hypothetical protein
MNLGIYDLTSPMLLSLGSASVEVSVLTVSFEISVSCCHYWLMLLSEQKIKGTLSFLSPP